MVDFVNLRDKNMPDSFLTEKVKLFSVSVSCLGTVKYTVNINRMYLVLIGELLEKN